MRDNQDPLIGRLFAEQDQTGRSDDFLRQVSQRVDKRQRVRRVYKRLALLACLVLSMLSALWIARGAALLIELAALGIGAIGPLLYEPVTWLVVGATVAAWSPIIYLWRTGRW
jgi:hypothetical protein